MAANQINWLVEHFRVTIFPIIGQDIDPQKVFLEIAGTEPDEVHTRKDSDQQVLLVSTDDYLLQLVVQPDRVHWYLGVNPIPNRASTFPPFGEYREKLNEFTDLCHRWFNCKLIPEVERIAYGAGLFYPVDSKEEGYKLLHRFIPSIDLDPENTSDFILQINRLRTLDKPIAGLRINRLAKWLVLLIQSANLGITSAGLTPKRQAEAFTLRLELDLSTGQEWNKPFVSEVVEDLMNLLIQFGDEISLEGDIP